MRKGTCSLACAALLSITAGCGGSKSGGSSSTPTPCVSETDAAFCTRLNACEQKQALDNCGVDRVVECGGCTNPSLACIQSTCRTPACSTLAFTNALGPITAASANNAQDAIQSVSGPSNTLLFQRSATCSNYALLIADPVGPGALDYSALQVSGTNLSGVRTDQESTLTLVDPLTLAGVSTDGTQLLVSTRPSAGSADFGPLSAGSFANITATPPASIGAPVVSPDGLALYYRLSGSPNAADDGIYESVRISVAAAFPAATRMPGPVQSYQVVTGVSIDRMTLFMQTDSFSSVALSRRSLRDPFANPTVPSAAGFRMRPTADCSTVIATCTPGGCLGEDTCAWARP